MKKTGGTVEISAVTSYNDYDAVHLCMLQRIQDITIFELTYVMDKPEMEEIQGFIKTSLFGELCSYLETTFAERTQSMLSGSHTDLDVEIQVLRDRLKLET